MQRLRLGKEGRGHPLQVQLPIASHVAVCRYNATGEGLTARNA
jgi:hypothetical protein